jgi:sec-independent protein translocase protein TatA
MLIALIGPLGLPELLIILAVLILIFGASRLSGLGRGLGQSIRGFKEEMRKMDTGDEKPKEPRVDQRASR